MFLPFFDAEKFFIFPSANVIGLPMREIQCTYKNERFSVRDDGTVLRHPLADSRSRPYDNQWTSGKPNRDGYLVIASMAIHRIVATAFLGEPPTDVMSLTISIPTGKIIDLATCDG